MVTVVWAAASKFTRVCFLIVLFSAVLAFAQGSVGSGITALAILFLMFFLEVASLQNRLLRAELERLHEKQMEELK